MGELRPGSGCVAGYARSDFRLEKNAVRKRFRIDGEDKIGLVVSTPGWGELPNQI